MPRAKGKASKRELAEYHRKRDFANTPEPSGDLAAKRNRANRLRFVVQKHRATRLHYDFRLEADGVLKSWAVPKGPSLDPAERRLAMHVEDHPLDYRDFEGIIPKGNYGAGEVIVWDRGTYRLAEGTDPSAEIARGKIKFVLSGKKIRGMFTLVKIRGKSADEDPWLLIKDRDEGVDERWRAEEHEASVVSGKSLGDIAASRNPKRWVSSKPAAKPKGKLPARPQRAIKLPAIAQPMLATLVDRPFDDPDWLFELKWDGFRAIARISSSGELTLTSRNGHDLLVKFPELEALPDGFNERPLIVDGEIVSLDKSGKSSFQQLQNRIERARPGKKRGGEPVTFVAFDLLFGDGRDLRREPLEKRKAALERILVPGAGAMFSKHVAARGIELYRFAESKNLEGIVGKRRDAPYRERRTRDWVKIKIQLRQECVIGGWTEPRGSRKGFGALLVGLYDRKGKLHFAGSVGTGFDGALLAAVGAKLQPFATERCPFAVRPQTIAPSHWVKPKLVAEVRFTEWTREGSMRHPVFLGLRADKAPKECVREVATAAEEVA